jgi:hypothetical protein
MTVSTAACNMQRAVGRYRARTVYRCIVGVWIIQGFGEVKTRLRESQRFKLRAHMLVCPDGVDPIASMRKSKADEMC